MGARHLAASTALIPLLAACVARAPDLPDALALAVAVGDEVPRVLWVAAGPDAWDGPVIGQALAGFEDALRGRLQGAVGAARVVRHVKLGTEAASARSGPALDDDAPWTLSLRVMDWGVRTGDDAVEAFVHLDATLLDEDQVSRWRDRLACVSPLLPASVPGAAEVARAVVGLENETLRDRYSALASDCGERAWALASTPGR